MEKVEWLNSLLGRIWPKLGPTIVHAIQEKGHEAIQEKLRELKPPFVVSSSRNCLYFISCFMC